MRVFGLIGYPLEHSFSRKYFTEKFKREGIIDAVYELFPISSINELPQLIKDTPELAGLNVTIPYKEVVINFVDDLAPEAGEIGAVNCIRIETEGETTRLKGYNTDIHGFEKTLKPLLYEGQHAALILGTGGASKAVAYVLKKMNIPFRYVSRKPKREDILGYDQINEEKASHYNIWINTTPLGMYPKENTFPQMPFELVTGKHILYDLVYNPEITAFLKKGIEYSAITSNGLGMLHEQAEEAWKIWNQSK